MPYESTHTFDVIIKKGKGGSIDKKQIQKGKNRVLCFDQRGSYTITPDSCYKFSEEKFNFETSQQEIKPIVFLPTHLKVEGSVLLKDEE